MESGAVEAQKIRLSCRIDDLAIPEIHTGAVEECDDFDDCGLDESICYDTVAIPEVHYSRCVGRSCAANLKNAKHSKAHS